MLYLCITMKVTSGSSVLLPRFLCTRHIHLEKKTAKTLLIYAHSQTSFQLLKLHFNYTHLLGNIPSHNVKTKVLDCVPFKKWVPLLLELS